MNDFDGSAGRRRFLRSLLTAPLALGTGAPWGSLGEARAAEALLAASTPTPECGDDDDPTPPQTEGPFYSPGNPRRASLLEPGLTGDRIVLSGRVFARDCRPVPGAMLDFWHADDRGEYDHEGFRCRGHPFADRDVLFRPDLLMATGAVTGQRAGRFHFVLDMA